MCVIYFISWEMYFAYHNLVNSVCYIQAKTHDTVQTWLLQTFVHANLDHECYFSILGYLKRCRVQVLTLVLHNVKKKVFPDPSLYHLWEHVSLDSTASFTHKTWFFFSIVCPGFIYFFCPSLAFQIHNIPNGTFSFPPQPEPVFVTLSLSSPLSPLPPHT